MKNKKLISVIVSGLLASLVFTSCSTGSNTSDGFNKSEEISVISREDGSGTRGAFIELFSIEEKSADGSKIDKTTKEAIIAPKTDIMMTNVSGDTYAIGYISLGSLNDTVKALAIDGVQPTAENVANKTYPIARPFNIAYAGELTELKKDFIDFIVSGDGQSVVAKSYIPINSLEIPFEGSKPSGKLVIAGSSSVSPIVEKLAEAYKAINENATIEVQMSDSTSGMNAAIDGTADIGMSSRELKDSEKEKLNSLEIAIDGIAVIVNKNNDLDSVFSLQVKEIFTGVSTNWNDIF